MSRAHNLGPDLKECSSHRTSMHCRRIEWAVQDLAGFADQVLVGPRTDPADRARAAALFIDQFDAGNEVDTTIAADAFVVKKTQPS